MVDIDALNQLMVDKLSPLPWARWTIFLFCLIVYLAKTLSTGTHHIITYVVGVYLFHGFILFATPKSDNIPDPFEVEEEADDENVYAPIDIDNSLRPFVRNMPEYKYWVFSMKVLLISFLLTLTSITDIPVYAPILVAYFIFMVVATIFKLWQHCNKYNYSPFFQEKNLMKE
ncbi:hypothetical protein PAEPH01_0730 [Pancytospora epiphaga]|nr:hypothetical protein PAEPH01_0730 [Pancytospora epiphaga]